jgi:CheY-like chemotaxis protein
MSRARCAVSESYAILVVDDNESNRDLLSRRLSKKGYSVTVAEDGNQALRILADQAVDLILLDIMMPGINGLDVLRAVRQRFTNAELPVIMATAKTTSDDMVAALEMGANDYVTKPLDFPVVLARVEAQIRQLASSRARAAAAAVAGGDDEPGPGKTVGGRYRLESTIGSGAFGTVYRARQTDLDRAVAVKVLQNHATRRPDQLKRFQREGIAACRIRHPNAVSVLDFGVTSSAAFLVMELLEGHSLEVELQKVTRIPVVRCSEILRPICGVLGEAHAVGIVHRDIKPANVFLHRSSRGEVVKVLDFGIAKFMGDAQESGNLTQEGGIIGTPAYMAPERFRGGTPDASWDSYSLGVMLYQMLGGQLPFPNSNTSDLLAVALMHMNDVPVPLRSLNPEITAELETVVAHAMHKDPSARPSVRELSSDFAKAVGMSPDRSSIYVAGQAMAMLARGAAEEAARQAAAAASETVDQPAVAAARADTLVHPPSTEPRTEIDEEGQRRGQPTRASGEE